MGWTTRRTYQQLLPWFPDNAACLEYLGRLRWPDGFVCPACGGERFWRTGAGLWMCRACGRRTSVTAGTIFHRTRTPMSTWFAAIWFVTSQKNGMSALGLQRVLGFGSYETAWAWLHKLRRAMVRPDRDRLSGTVEVDETMVGGSQPRHARGRHRQGPGDDRGGTQRAAVWAGSGSPSPTGRAASPWSTSPPRSSNPARRSDRRRTDCCAGSPTSATPTSPPPATAPPTRPRVLPGVHLVASLLKRWLIGTLHYRVEQQHLPYYLDEYTFRFNRRNAEAAACSSTGCSSKPSNTDPHPLTNCSDPDNGILGRLHLSGYAEHVFEHGKGDGFGRGPTGLCRCCARGADGSAR